MQSISIAPLTKADIHNLCALEAACFCDSWSKQNIEAIFNMQGVHTFGAYINHIVVGYIIIQNIDICEIFRIGVSPAFQNKYIGQKLLYYVLDIFKQNTILEVDCQNKKALGLYKKIGFNIIHIRKNYYTHKKENKYYKSDAYVMQKIYQHN